MWRFIMENKRIKEAEEMYRIISIDFKDELGYEVEIEGFKEMSAIQKWLIYDEYTKKDADVVIKGNMLLAEVLGWDVKWLDGIFPVRQIIKTLLKTIGQKLDVNKIPGGKKEIYDIINGKALTEKLHDAGIGNHVRSWHKIFSEQMERLCKNVHTIGNYMPCPDGDYNRVKGLWKWKYNDRIDLLYSDILEPWCKKENGDYFMPQEQRKKWKAWFDKNKDKLLLTEILDEKTRAELRKFGCIKHATFSSDELKELPEYLKKVNQLIEHRTERIKTICTKAVYNMYFECYKNALSEFEHGKVFLQICSFSKGYVWVAPEYEKKFEDGDLGKLFNLEIGKYFNKRPIDKVVGEASWENLLEYAYLSLYDCYIDEDLSAQKNWDLDLLKSRAAYFAFKEHDLVKDYRPHYDSK